MSEELNADKFARLEKENEALRQTIKDIKSEKRKRFRRGLRFKLGKKATYAFIGKGLKNSIKQLYSELPGPVKKDTFADVSAHLVWRLTRIGVFAFLVGVTPLLILLSQTYILGRQNRLLENQNELLKLQVSQVSSQNKLIQGQNHLFEDQNNLFKMQNEKVDVTNDLVQGQNKLVYNQNSMFDNQNKLVEKQTRRIVQQTELIEAERRSSLVFLMGNILDKIDNELKSDNNQSRKISDELIGRISALSQSLKPYRYLKNDQLTKKPLSPERGQLLLSIVNSNLDTEETYPRIYTSTKFSRADLDEAFLRGAFLKGAKLTNADLKDADLNGAVMDEAILTDADFKSVEAIHATFVKALLDEANFSNSNLRRADFSGANLEEALFVGADMRKVTFDEETTIDGTIFNKADMSKSDLRGVKFKNCSFKNTTLDFAKVSTKNWFEKMEDKKVKGLKMLQNKYSLKAVMQKDNEEVDYYILEPIP